MAELQEVFEDFGTNSKKLLKSKPFKLALLGVAGVALFVAWRNSGEEEHEVDGYVVADGYAGYPETYGGGGGYEDGVSESTGLSADEVSSMIQSSNEQLAADMSGVMSSMMSAMPDYSADIAGLYSYMDETNSNVESLSEQMLEMQDYNAYLLEGMMYQNALEQMKANSELYNNTSDYQLKQQLHAENMGIAQTMGLSFDDSTGNYVTPTGDYAYTTMQQQSSGNAPMAEGETILSKIGSWFSGLFSSDLPSNAPSSINYAGGSNGSMYSAASTVKKTGVSTTPNYTNNRTYQSNYNNAVSSAYSSNQKKTSTKSTLSGWYSSITSGVSNAPSSINRSSGSSGSSKKTTKKTGGATTVTSVTKTTTPTGTKTVTTYSNGGTKSYSGGSRNSGGTVQKTKYTATQRAQQERNAVDWEG